jgi:hypothetical protein
MTLLELGVVWCMCSSQSYARKLIGGTWPAVGCDARSRHKMKGIPYDVGMILGSTLAVLVV